jgi:hypothetical protein
LGRLDEPAPRCARIWHFGHTFVPGYLRLTGYLHFGGYFTFASYLPFVSNLLRVRCLCPVSQHPGFLHAFTRYPATCTRYHLHVPATTVAHICNRLHVQSCAGTTGRICLPMPVQPVATTPIRNNNRVQLGLQPTSDAHPSALWSLNPFVVPLAGSSVIYLFRQPFVRLLGHTLFIQLSFIAPSPEKNLT